MKSEGPGARALGDALTRMYPDRLHEPDEVNDLVEGPLDNDGVLASPSQRYCDTELNEHAALRWNPAHV